MKLENPKTPKLYVSPKIHKQGNPGGPAITQSILKQAICLSL